MSKNLENLKKAVEGKSKTIQNYVMLLDDFHRKANSKTQQFIVTLLLTCYLRKERNNDR